MRQVNFVRIAQYRKFIYRCTFLSIAFVVFFIIYSWHKSTLIVTKKIASSPNKKILKKHNSTINLTNRHIIDFYQTLQYLTHALPDSIWMNSLILVNNEIILSGKAQNNSILLNYKKILTRNNSRLKLESFSIESEFNYQIKMKIISGISTTSTPLYLDDLIQQELQRNHLVLVKFVTGKKSDFFLQFVATYASVLHFLQKLTQTKLSCLLKISLEKQSAQLILVSLRCN